MNVKKASGWDRLDSELVKYLGKGRRNGCSSCQMKQERLEQCQRIGKRMILPINKNGDTSNCKNS